MAEARAVKLFTQFSYSYQKNKKSPQKGCGYGHVTYLKPLSPLRYPQNG